MNSTSHCHDFNVTLDQQSKNGSIIIIAAEEESICVFRVPED
jgi:hypothetical protein